MKKIKLLAALVTLFCSSAVWAYGGSGGGWATGANIGFINSDQKDMNKEIDARNSTTGAKNFGNAWEVNGHISYRMSGSSVAISLRPSYFMYNKIDGTSATYQLSGFTVFPTLKFFMLENKDIKFYSQFGVGYGHVSGEIEDAGMDVKFSGGNIGYMAGLGAEFCFGSHCLNIEGGLRFLSIDRMLVDSSSGTEPSGSRLTQIDKGSELEINDSDFSSTMSGILGMAGYTYYF